MMLTQKKIGRALVAAALTSLAGGIAIALPLVENDNWRVPQNLEALAGSSPNLNTPAVDGCASLSPDGLTIAFTSNRTGTFDVYVASRPNTSVGFGNPVALPAGINTAANDSCPTLLRDRLYFSSDREDPAYDIYMSRRVGTGWSAPIRLGRNVNPPGREEESAALYRVGTHEILLFSSRNLDGSDGKIYQSIDGGPKSLVMGGPNAVGSNNRPSITADGRTIYFDSDRAGTFGGPDIYYATRQLPFGPFGIAIHARTLSSPAFDARPFISNDGRMITFGSNRAGTTSPAPDTWFATR
jgi:Tol biopolymer transport system component